MLTDPFWSHESPDQLNTLVHREFYFQVDEKALHGSVRGMHHQVKVELLDKEKLKLQDLF